MEVPPAPDSSGTVGAAVGGGVGGSVGRGVGASVGSGDGSGVGSAVGRGDGRSVGRRVFGVTEIASTEIPGTDADRFAFCYIRILGGGGWGGYEKNEREREKV